MGAPPCTLVLLTVCRRKSPLLLLPPSRSRSSLLQRGNTPFGSEDPSLLLSPPSNRCGSPSRNTMSAAHPSSTASASKPSALKKIFENIQKLVCFNIGGKRRHSIFNE